MATSKPVFKDIHADQSPGLLIWQVNNAWQRRINAALQPFGLTQGQFALLASIVYLDEQGETLTQVRLAQHAHADVMMTSTIVRLLEKRKLLERKQNEKDTRAKVLKPTAAGIELTRQSLVAVHQVDKAFFGALGAKVPELNRLLLVLRDMK